MRGSEARGIIYQLSPLTLPIATRWAPSLSHRGRGKRRRALPPSSTHPHLLALAVARLAGARFAFVRSAHHRRTVLVSGQAEFLRLQRPDLVTQAPCRLEFEIGCRSAHLFFEILDVRAQIMADHVRAVFIDFDRHLVARRDVLDDIADIAAD